MSNVLSNSPMSLRPVDKPPDLVVGVVEERSERLLEPRGQALLVLR